MFSMFSMLAMQWFCTLLHASRMYSQKLRCPSELNQLPEPDPKSQTAVRHHPPPRRQPLPRACNRGDGRVRRSALTSVSVTSCAAVSGRAPSPGAVCGLQRYL